MIHLAKTIPSRTKEGSRQGTQALHAAAYVAAGSWFSPS